MEQAYDYIDNKTSVALQDSKGIAHLFMKTPHRKDGKGVERLQEYVKRLNEKDIPVTWLALQSLGFGRGTISKWKNALSKLEDPALVLREPLLS